MSGELPLESKPHWIVVPIYKRRTKDQRRRNVAPVLKHHELQYDGKSYDQAIGEGEVRRLREMASHLNFRKLTPRDRIQCAADHSNPGKYLRDHTPPPA